MAGGAAHLVFPGESRDGFAIVPDTKNKKKQCNGREKIYAFHNV
jgi:hypothetical protein